MLILKLWNKIMYLGVYEELGFMEKNRIRLLNLLSSIVFIFVLFYFTLNLVIGKYNFVMINTILLFSTSLVLYLNHHRKYTASRVIYFIILNLFLTAVSVLFGKTRGIEYFLLVSAVTIFIFFDQFKTLIALFTFTVFCFIIAKIGHLYVLPLEQPNDPYAMYFNYLNMAVLFIGMFLISYFFQNEYISNQKLVESQNRELRQLNGLKDRFLSIVSHDIRSPLNSLQAMTSLMGDGNLTQDETRMLAKELSEKLSGTQNMLDDLLNWVKLQSQGFNEPLQMVSLKELADESMASLGGLKEKRIDYINYIDPDVSILAESNMLKMVIRNLFSNAIKFSNEQGEIAIYASIKHHLIEICIEDNGIGISAENQTKIFNPNINFSTKGTSNEKGTGLGLLLCKELIQKSGGNIRLESEEGKGSRFKITLPNPENKISGKRILILA